MLWNMRLRVIYYHAPHKDGRLCIMDYAPACYNYHRPHKEQMIRTETIMPCEALRPYVRHYWILQTDSAGLSQVIMPSGSLRWQFHRKRPFDVDGVAQPLMRASVIGIYDKAKFISTAEDIEMISVSFYPYASQVIMGMPCREFASGPALLDSLCDRGLRELQERVLESATTADCIAMIERFLLQRLAPSSAPHCLGRLSHAFHVMSRHPDMPVSELADVACMGERQFRRVFVENIGVSPKQMQRIQRLHLAVGALTEHRHDSMEPLLRRYGYADHSHFNHEFHDIAGMSPTDYLRFLKETGRHGVLHAYRSFLASC